MMGEGVAPVTHHFHHSLSPLSPYTPHPPLSLHSLLYHTTLPPSYPCHDLSLPPSLPPTQMILMCASGLRLKWSLTQALLREDHPSEE